MADMLIVMADYRKGMSVEQLKAKYKLTEKDLKTLNENIQNELGVKDGTQPLPGSTEITLDDGTKVLAAKIRTVNQPKGGFVNVYMAQDGKQYYQYTDANGKQQKITKTWDSLSAMGGNIQVAWNKMQDGHPLDALMTLMEGAEDPRGLTTGVAPAVGFAKGGGIIKSMKDFGKWLKQLKNIKSFEQFKSFAMTFIKNMKPTKQAQPSKPLPEILDRNINNIDQVITTNVPGQKVIISRDLDDASQFIATFINDGIPSTTTKLPLEKLSYFISNLK